MPFALEQLSQGISIAGTEIDPQQQAAGTVYTGGVDMEHFQRVLFVLMVGNVGAGGTVNAQLQSSSASNFSAGPNNIAGTAITQVAANNKIATVEVRSDQLTPGDRYVRLQVTVGTNAVYIAALALGGEAEHKPASKQDIAAVAQRLVL
jgi:hypothetical protein